MELPPPEMWKSRDTVRFFLFFIFIIIIFLAEVVEVVGIRASVLDVS